LYKILIPVEIKTLEVVAGFPFCNCASKVLFQKALSFVLIPRRHFLMYKRQGKELPSKFEAEDSAKTAVEIA